jgi:hypothetical protein
VTLIIVTLDQPLLYEYFRWAFETERGVRVVLDRRRARRRERAEARAPDRRRADRRRRPSLTAELRARGFVLLPMPTIWLAPPSSRPVPESAPVPQSLPEKVPVSKPVASVATGAEGPALAGHRETPEPEPDPEWEPFVSRLMARAVVELERDGRRYVALRDNPRARVWRCGSCSMGVIAATSGELLPRVGQTCIACQAKIVRSEVVHPARRGTPTWRRLVTRALRMWRGS